MKPTFSIEWVALWMIAYTCHSFRLLPYWFAIESILGSTTLSKWKWDRLKTSIFSILIKRLSTILSKLCIFPIFERPLFCFCCWLFLYIILRISIVYVALNCQLASLGSILYLSAQILDQTFISYLDEFFLWSESSCKNWRLFWVYKVY